jgi:hypothetical protein
MALVNVYESRCVLIWNRGSQDTRASSFYQEEFYLCSQANIISGVWEGKNVPTLIEIA